MTKKENRIAEQGVDLLLYYKHLCKTIDNLDYLLKTAISSSVENSKVNWKYIKTDIYDVYSSAKSIKDSIEKGEYTKSEE